MKQIQWYPGHMVKARRQVEEKLGVIDVVFELLDARAVKSSQNPELSSIIKNKPRMVLLNKADLADPIETKKWINYFEANGIACVGINSLQDDLRKTIRPRLELFMKPLREKEEKKGMMKRALRVMVLGIPNVGKSQFINRLSQKNKTKTGDKPGVTKVQQYLRIDDEYEILDNPGILWPKFEDELVGKTLALIGSIKAEILPTDEVVFFGIETLLQHYPQVIKNLVEVTEYTPINVLEALARKRGLLLKGAQIDYDRTMNVFLQDLRSGKLGRFSYDRVG